MLVCFSPHDCVFRTNTRTVPSFLFFILQKLFIKSLSNCSLLYEDYFILLPKSREWRRDCGFSSMCECQTVQKTCMVCGGSRICSDGGHRDVWKRRMVSGYVSMALALAKRGGGMEGVMCNRHECVLLYRHSWQWSTHKLGFGPMSLGFVTLW